MGTALQLWEPPAGSFGPVRVQIIHLGKSAGRGEEARLIGLGRKLRAPVMLRVLGDTLAWTVRCCSAGSGSHPRSPNPAKLVLQPRGAGLPVPSSRVPHMSARAPGGGPTSSGSRTQLRCHQLTSVPWALEAVHPCRVS